MFLQVFFKHMSLGKWGILQMVTKSSLWIVLKLKYLFHCDVTLLRKEFTEQICIVFQLSLNQEKHHLVVKMSCSKILRKKKLFTTNVLTVWNKYLSNS